MSAQNKSSLCAPSGVEHETKQMTHEGLKKVRVKIPGDS